MKDDVLKLTGVRQHNLKNFDLTVEHNKFIAITGVSGSGKSSLAFDTIYAEGGRRYIETFSPYTRQFLDRLERPDVDVISGVRPAIALEQRNRISNSRSTVGTLTEINDYLKLIWANLSSVHCPSCDLPIVADTAERVLEASLVQLTEKTLALAAIAFPLTLSGTASAESVRNTLAAEGFVRFIDPSTQQLLPIEEFSGEVLEILQVRQAPLAVVVDRLRYSVEVGGDFRKRFISSVNQAYRFGHDHLLIGLGLDQNSHLELFEHSLIFRCPNCKTNYEKPRPSLFSFNNPLGACDTCHGFGSTLNIDPELCVPDPNLSIDDGAIVCWSSKSTSRELRKLKTFCREQEIDTSNAWGGLPKRERELIFDAEHSKHGFRGIMEWFRKLERKKYKMHVRVLLARYRSQRSCHSCHGTRLKKQALLYRLENQTLPKLWSLPIAEAVPFFEGLLARHSDEESISAAIAEVLSRLTYLLEVGLEYLTLDRPARTLSGGESQRVNLTTFLGTRLVNTMLVLDEPSIGLHQRDTNRLVQIMRSLRDRGNSVLVVEHDTEIIRHADEIIDLGPAAGAKGGQVVFQGPPSEILNCTESLTGRYLNQDPEINYRPAKAFSKVAKEISIKGARAHNLKNIDVTFPLNCLVVVSGVSGSGKSSLIKNCMFATYEKKKQGLHLSQIIKRSDATVSGISGLDNIDEMILVDQSPVGNTPRSNAATYTKAWEIVREAFAETAAATALGLSKSAFSFNVDGGRCPVCKGAGYQKIEMQFLADVYVRCERCDGARFQESILQVRLGNKNIKEVLDLTLAEADELFGNLGDESRGSEIRGRLAPLIELGLGYLKLGQPLSQLSGGEAQRVKLASYLQPNQNQSCLFVFDEPTTGLHPHDIQNLLQAFGKLIALGHSVLVIEHNLLVIKSADFLIDLGPEGGAGGGELLCAGKLAEVLRDKKSLTRSHTLRCLKVKEAPLETSLSNKPSRKAKRSEAATAPAPIEIWGARHHNLKNISLKIPKDKLTVITGVSGSGKSSLAFDILFAEGQRRFIDCLSPYARQFMAQVQRADVDRVEGIPPTIAISQKTAPPPGISTIATTTEIYQYLRLLYAKVGEQRCPDHNLAIIGSSAENLATQILEQHTGQRLFVFAPAVLGRKGYYTELFRRALKAEISEAKIDGKVVSISSELKLERHKIHWISLLVAQLTISKGNRSLIEAAIEQALVLGNGAVEIALGAKTAPTKVLSTERICPSCKRGFLELDPQIFSFRSSRGVCNDCDGRGQIFSRNGSAKPCPSCHGARISPLGRSVFVANKAINELTRLTAQGLLDFLTQNTFPARIAPIISPILRELNYRLEMMVSVGLDYLALDRDASSISGGEAQRLRLVRALGAPLTGVCYVLDEPTIGLHPKDHSQLMETLRRLRDDRNTVVVVEHDEETIRAADFVVDVGPEGGAKGGYIVSQGTVQELESCAESATGRALLKRRLAPPSGLVMERKKLAAQYLTIKDASINNLQKISVKIPLGQLTVVAGVSGAGKSSLVHGTLVAKIIEEFEGKSRKQNIRPGAVGNTSSLKRIIEIDQSPIGRTPASIPLSYLGVLDEIRKVYALVPEAKMAGWGPSRFSFNSKGGRCEACGGRGYLSIPMSFLPNATVNCETCNGMRYNEATLEVRYQGFSIGELLCMTFDEATALFSNHRKIKRVLNYVQQLGLGYLTVGQPSSTLSGGEAQRLKIATELGSTDSQDTLYVLDEPTTGLHMTDVDKLMGVLSELTKKGNTVVLIEHNLDVLRVADYLIELGPGPGKKGGRVVFEGPPWKMQAGKNTSSTKEYLFPDALNHHRSQVVANSGA